MMKGEMRHDRRYLTTVVGDVARGGLTLPASRVERRSTRLALGFRRPMYGGFVAVVGRRSKFSVVSVLGPVSLDRHTSVIATSDVVCRQVDVCWILSTDLGRPVFDGTWWLLVQRPSAVQLTSTTRYIFRRSADEVVDGSAVVVDARRRVVLKQLTTDRSRHCSHHQEEQQEQSRNPSTFCIHCYYIIAYTWLAYLI